MKSLVVDLTDGIANVLVVMAELNGVTVEDLLRAAVNAHVVGKITSGELGPLAKAALADIEAQSLEAVERIAEIFDFEAGAIDITPRRRTSDRSKGERQRIGFAPPARPERRG